MASVVGSVPVAYVLGIWLSGWEEPPPYIVRGADKNPLYSGAGSAILLSFVGLFVLATAVWYWAFVRLADRGRH